MKFKLTPRTLALIGILAIAALCVAGTKISRLTGTISVDGNALFIVTTGATPGVALGNTRQINASNLLNSFMQLPNWTNTIGNQPGSTILTNLSGTGAITNVFTIYDPATQFTVVLNGTNTTGRFVPIVAGTNLVIYTNASGGIVINGQPGSGGSGGLFQPAHTVLTNLSATSVTPAATNDSAYIHSASGRGTNTTIIGIFQVTNNTSFILFGTPGEAGIMTNNLFMHQVGNAAFHGDVTMTNPATIFRFDNSSRIDIGRNSSSWSGVPSLRFGSNAPIASVPEGVADNAEHRRYRFNGDTTGNNTNWIVRFWEMSNYVAITEIAGSATVDPITNRYAAANTFTNLGDLVQSGNAFFPNLTPGAAAINGSFELIGLPHVSEAELGWLDGVTSPIQTQLDNKQPLDQDLTNISGTGAITNLISQSASNATSKPLVVPQSNGFHSNTTGRIYGLEGTGGVTITVNNSNLVISAAPGGGIGGDSGMPQMNLSGNFAGMTNTIYDNTTGFLTVSNFGIRGAVTNFWRTPTVVVASSNIIADGSLGDKFKYLIAGGQALTNIVFTNIQMGQTMTFLTWVTNGTPVRVFRDATEFQVPDYVGVNTVAPRVNSNCWTWIEVTRTATHTNIQTFTRELEVVAGSGVTFTTNAVTGEVSISAGAPIVFTNQLWVEMRGNDSTGARNDPSKPFQTLSNAMAATIPGDVINVGNGRFTNLAGPLTISNSVTVRGLSWNNTVLLGTNALSTTGVNFKPMDNSTIEHLRLEVAQNLGVPIPLLGRHSSFDSGGFTNVTVRNVRFVGFSDNIVITTGSSDPCIAQFIDCEFDTGGDMVVLHGSADSHLKFQRCHFYGHDAIATTTCAYRASAGNATFEFCNFASTNNGAVVKGLELISTAGARILSSTFNLGCTSFNPSNVLSTSSRPVVLVNCLVTTNTMSGYVVQDPTFVRGVAAGTGVTITTNSSSVVTVNASGGDSVWTNDNNRIRPVGYPATVQVWPTNLGVVDFGPGIIIGANSSNIFENGFGGNQKDFSFMSFRDVEAGDHYRNFWGLAAGQDSGGLRYGFAALYTDTNISYFSANTLIGGSLNQTFEAGNTPTLGNRITLTTNNNTAFNVDGAGGISVMKGVAQNWPSAQGAAGTVLTNDGSGVLGWGAVTGGPGFGDLIWTNNGQTILPHSAYVYSSNRLHFGSPTTTGPRTNKLEWIPLTNSLRIGSVADLNTSIRYIPTISNYWDFPFNNAANTYGFGSNILIQSVNSSILGGANNTISSNSASSVIVGGTNNFISTNSYWSFIGGGNNSSIHISSEGAVIGGGLDNTIMLLGVRSFIGGGHGNRLGLANGTGSGANHSVIGGGVDNNVRGGTANVIGGGNANKTVQGSDYSGIVGGDGNQIGIVTTGSDWAFVGGGNANGIDGDVHYGFIGGGQLNRIGSSSPHSAILGGFTNYLGGSSGGSALIGSHSHINDSVSNAFLIGVRITNATARSVLIGANTGGTPTNSLHITGNATTNIGPLKVSAGNGFVPVYAGVGGTLTNSATPIVNAGTSETNMITANIPANVLTNAGDRITFRAAIRFAATADNKAFTVTYGSEVIYSSGTVAQNDGDAVLHGEIIRTGNTSQSCNVGFNGNGAFDGASTSETAQTNGIATVLKITATGAASGVITNRSLVVEWHPTR